METKRYPYKHQLTLLLDPRIAGFDWKRNPPELTLHDSVKVKIREYEITFL